MHPLITATLSIRKTMIGILRHHSIDELNYIPEGFNNNIFWNIGHVISIQQILVLGLAGQTWKVEKNIVKEYKKDTKPERTYTQKDVDTISQLLIDSIHWTQVAFEANAFTDYTEYKTLTGFVINDFDSACTFNLFHEGLHMGYIQCIRKFLK